MTDDTAQTLAEYERLAITTGQWAGTDRPEFSADNETWSDVWDQARPPRYARATVYRKDFERPITVKVSWDEAVPADEVERGEWFARPMTRFGAYALRAAYRRGFGDVIRVEPTPPVSVDWDAAILATKSAAEVDELRARMRGHQAVTAPRDIAMKARRASFAPAASSPLVDAVRVGAAKATPVPHPPAPGVPRLVKAGA